MGKEIKSWSCKVYLGFSSPWVVDLNQRKPKYLKNEQTHQVFLHSHWKKINVCSTSYDFIAVKGAVFFPQMEAEFTLWEKTCKHVWQYTQMTARYYEGISFFQKGLFNQSPHLMTFQRNESWACLASIYKLCCNDIF